METRFRELALDQPRVRRDLFSRHSTRSIPRFVHPDIPPKILDEIRALPNKPLISVVTDNATCIDSVRAQWYPYWELCIPADLDTYRGMDPRIKVICGNSHAASTGEYVITLGPAGGDNFSVRNCCRAAFAERNTLVQKTDIGQ